MRDMFLIENGIIGAREFGAPSATERAALALRRAAEADALQADTTAAETAIVLRPNQIRPDLEADYRRAAVQNKIVSLRADAALLGKPDTRTQIDATIYVESAVGAAPVWPRAHRDALLTATDYVEVAGWRSNKSADTLSAAVAYRAALRNLPASSSDPITVVWPDKPTGI